VNLALRPRGEKHSSRGCCRASDAAAAMCEGAVQACLLSSLPAAPPPPLLAPALLLLLLLLLLPLLLSTISTGPSPLRFRSAAKAASLAGSWLDD
jgi:hypothetical protein